MTKHLTDRPSSSAASARLARFLRVERHAHLHPSIAAMRKKPRARTMLGGKLVRYAELDRAQPRLDY